MENSYDVIWDGQKAGKVKVYDKGLMTVYEGVCAVSTKKVLRLCALCKGKYVTIGVLVPEGGKLSIKRSFSKNTMREKGLEETASFVLMCSEDEFEPIKTAAPAQETAAEPAEYVPVGDESETQNETEDNAENSSENETDCREEPEETEEEESMDEASCDRTDGDSTEEIPEAVRAFPGIPEAPPEVNGWRENADPSSLFCDTEMKEACRNVHNAMTKQDGGAMLLAVPWVTGEPFPMMSVFCLGYAENIGGREYIVFRIENGQTV